LERPGYRDIAALYATHLSAIDMEKFPDNKTSGVTNHVRDHQVGSHD
jgi:hypothetical protein